MYASEMPRKDKGFRLDTRIIEALAKVKDLTGKSSNAYVEELLMMNLKSLGVIPVDAEPLTELRGGARPGAGKPKQSNSLEQEPIAENPDPKFSDFDSVRIEELQLETRTYNILKRNQINTLGDLIAYTEQDVRQFKDCGSKSIEEIRNALLEKFQITWTHDAAK